MKRSLTKIKRKLWFEKMNVRFFVWDEEANEGEGDYVESDESDFLLADGVIDYQRDTVFENGVPQICLTKDPFKEC